MPDYIDLTGEDRLRLNEIADSLRRKVQPIESEDVHPDVVFLFDLAKRRALHTPGEPEGDLTPERRKQIEFDAWLSFRPEFYEVLAAFRDAFGTDTSAAAGDDPNSEFSRSVVRDSQPPADCGHPNHGNPDHDCRPFLPPAEGEEEKPPNVLSRAEARLVVVAILPAISGTPEVELADRLGRFAFPECENCDDRGYVEQPGSGQVPSDVTERVPCWHRQPDPPPADPQKGCEKHGAPDCEDCYVEALTGPADPQGEEWPEEIRIVKDGDGAVEVLHPCDTDPAARRYIPVPTEREGNERIANEVIAYHADQATTFELRAKAVEAKLESLEGSHADIKRARTSALHERDAAISKRDASRKARAAAEAKAQRYEEAEADYRSLTGELARLLGTVEDRPDRTKNDQFIAKVGALLAQGERYEEALRPFARFATDPELAPWADENGWTESAPRSDRIRDWFGPSDFYEAGNALTTPPDQGGDGEPPEGVATPDCHDPRLTDRCPDCQPEQRYSREEVEVAGRAIAAIDALFEHLQPLVEEGGGLPLYQAMKPVATARAALAAAFPKPDTDQPQHSVEEGERRIAAKDRKILELERALEEAEAANRSLVKMRDAALEGNLATPESSEEGK